MTNIEPLQQPELSSLTTMRVGGPAERVITTHTSEQLILAATELWQSGEEWLLLGGGSNTIVCDEGFPGTVVLVRESGFELVPDHALRADQVRIRVQAGQNWDEFVAATVANCWAGIEALSGIPGLAGAAPIQNIGAYGVELSEVLHSVEFLSADTFEVSRIPAADLQLGYRDSVFKHGLDGVVLSIDIVLASPDARTVGLSSPIRYGQLATELGVTAGNHAPIDEVRRAVLRLRAIKGMVLNEQDHDTWSAGSFFVNPIVPEKFATSLPENAPKFLVDSQPVPSEITTFEELQAGIPLRVPQPPQVRKVKLSAAWLIEHAGVPKGFRLPGSAAAISSKHTLALTNQGNARAEDIAELARYVAQRVYSEFGIVLRPEPNIYGLHI